MVKLIVDSNKNLFLYSQFRNSVIEYLPVPITDIILMKTTEKERMEKLQYSMNKVK
jgi:hypothetical protein